jgi:peptidoglycan/xylan/chitin deacetylase (PgdA/CDA1 family)
MARLVRFVVATALLGSLACASSGDDADDVPPYEGPVGTGSTVASAGAPNAAPSSPVVGGVSGTSEASPNPALAVVMPAQAPGEGSAGNNAVGAGGSPTAEGQGGAPFAAGGAPAQAVGGGGSGATLPPPVARPSGLPIPPGAAGVPQPAGAAQNLRVLNWAGFKAAFSFTFDDTNSSQIQHYQELNALGVPFTFYLITAGNQADELMSPVWRQALQDGHEIGNHTANHRDTGNPGLAADTDAGEATLERMFGITVYTMAAPFGAQDYINIASTRYLINRGTPGGTIAPNNATNPFNLPCFIPQGDAPIGDFNAKVDGVRAAGTWQTELVHGFTDANPNDNAFQPVNFGVFQQAVRYAKSFGDVWIDTIVDIGSYWRGQIAFQAAQRTPNGASTTLTWTLPNHFPPGKFLRVTVDGGTLTQAGAPLAWDAHGYYEVALDEGSVTLSP